MEEFYNIINSYQKKYNLKCIPFGEVIYRLSDGNGELFSKWDDGSKKSLIDKLGDEDLVQNIINDINSDLSNSDADPDTNKTGFLFVSGSAYSKQHVIKITKIKNRTYLH